MQITTKQKILLGITAVALGLIGFSITTAPEQFSRSAIIGGFLAIASIVVIFSVGAIKMLIPDKINLKRDIPLAIGFTILWIALSYIGFSIGVPSAVTFDQLSFLVIAIAFPIIETLFFIIVIPLLLFKATNNFLIAIIITSISAVAYHYVAYGSSLAGLNSAFISVFGFFALSIFITYKVANKSFLPAMLSHIAINSFIVLPQFLAVAGVN